MQVEYESTDLSKLIVGYAKRLCPYYGTAIMRWSNGRSLSLLPDVDDFTVISRPEKQQDNQKEKTSAKKRGTSRDVSR